jgi:lysophospholipase L1-like esterase
MVLYTNLNRRNLLAYGLASAALSLIGCARQVKPNLALQPGDYQNPPKMMAIGDSLYQGVRSLTFGPDMAPNSTPVLVAEQLGIPFIAPDPKQVMLFSLEKIYRNPLPLETNVFPFQAELATNAGKWQRGVWSQHQAFDNVAIGGAEIDSLWLDTYAGHIENVKAKLPWLFVDPVPYSILESLWYSLNVCFTLNPTHSDEQANCSQYEQVKHRGPQTLLVNIGSNEGLFSAAFQGNVTSAESILACSVKKMDDLGALLAELPPQTEKIVFNSLIRPRTATNLMPAESFIGTYPGDDYFDAYGPWLFSSKQTIPKSLMKQFDQQVQEQNDAVYRTMYRHLKDRLVWVDLYTASGNCDGKHYADRFVSANGYQLRNLPLRGQGKSLLQGGLTGLDNMHPSVPGYAVIADAVLESLKSPNRTNKDTAFQRDTLLTNLPRSMDQHHEQIVHIAGIINRLGKSGIAKPPPIACGPAAA